MGRMQSLLPKALSRLLLPANTRNPHQPRRQAIARQLDAGGARYAGFNVPFQRQLHLQGSGDSRRNLVLNGKDVSHFTIKTLGPNLKTIVSIDQLGGDADAIAGPPHTALYQGRHTELTRDIADVPTC